MKERKYTYVYGDVYRDFEGEGFMYENLVARIRGLVDWDKYIRVWIYIYMCIWLEKKVSAICIKEKVYLIPYVRKKRWKS